MTHIDPAVDWLAYATQRRRELKNQIAEAARRLEEKKNLPLPPPPVIEEPPPPPPPAPPPPIPSVFDKLASHVPLWKEIQLEVCAKHGVDLFKEIYADKRLRKYTLARQEIFYRLRHDAKMSLMDISKKMKRDHTTVMSGINRHAQRLEKEQKSCSTENS